MRLDTIHQHRLPTAILSADFSPDRKQVYAACLDGWYRLVLEDGSHQKLGEHESYVSGIHALPDGRVLTAGYDGTLRWWTSEGELTRTIQAHRFWSWDSAVSPDRRWIASVTGQYLAGSYRYEPASSEDPTVCVFDLESGELVHAFPMLPSVQAVAFSSDSRWVAAANLMGDVHVWSLESGLPVAAARSEDFTSWGIIKSHCYIGGIHALAFHPHNHHVVAAGMGPMRDPMAGNGKQRWQEFAWPLDAEGEGPVAATKVAETREDLAGEGLMEALAFAPDGSWFIMGGRLRGGNWNAALFASDSGDRLAELKTGFRITDLRVADDPTTILVAGTQGQPSNRNDEGRFPDFGRLEIVRYSVESSDETTSATEDAQGEPIQQ